MEHRQPAARAAAPVAPVAPVAPAAPADDEVLERLWRERYSCRAFLPDPVPRETITRLLTLAQRTASWCNSQPWQLAILSGAALERFRTALYAHVAAQAEGASDFPFPREYQGSALARRRESGFQLYDTLKIVRGDKAAYRQQMLENFRLFGAPHVAIITSDEALGVYGAVDCGAYVSSFLLAAQALGVATIAQAALAGYAGFVKAHLGLGPDRSMVCGISFGYADRAHPVNSYRTSRAAVTEAATFLEN